MSLQQIITELDNEIALLTEVRALLTGNHKGRKRRTLSAEGRQHIVDAQRKRWAKANKAAK
jgi:hypothetical protein